MAGTLLRHVEGILSYDKTASPVEKWKASTEKSCLLASAFGLRDHDFLKLRLYALHEAKFKFIG